MRKTMTMLVLFVAALSMAGIASGQFGGGGGGFFRKGPWELINNKSVQKELDLTEDQVKAIPGALDKAIGGVLSDKQNARFKQIELQQRGTAAFLDAKVQESLKLTDTQKDSIKTIIDDSRKELRDAGFKGGREKTEAITKASQEKISEVLSLDQKASWKKMVGETATVEWPQVGGNFKKKTTE